MSELGLTPLYSGKVRDLYEVDDHHLLMVASDRLSAFDVVMDETIPEKGRVLTGITNYWIKEFGSDRRVVAGELRPGRSSSRRFRDSSNRRSGTAGPCSCERLRCCPLECIVRGRLAGSAYDEYVARGTVHEMIVRAGTATRPTPFPNRCSLRRSRPRRATTSTSASNAPLCLEGAERVHHAQTLCVDLFTRAADALAANGLILADTKFELGFVDGELVLCDEVITPDSSRIWPADDVRSGETPPSFDKQPFRDWLTAQAWDRTPPPPAVPDDVVATTSSSLRRRVRARDRTLD